MRPLERALETAILGLLDTRAGTICPSEAARQVAARGGLRSDGDPDPEAWRTLMEPARRAARRLAAEGRVVITQNGRPVDPDDFHGPIRIGRGEAYRTD